MFLAFQGRDEPASHRGRHAEPLGPRGSDVTAGGTTAARRLGSEPGERQVCADHTRSSGSATQRGLYLSCGPIHSGLQGMVTVINHTM